jgi:hypothetical protein
VFDSVPADLVNWSDSGQVNGVVVNAALGTITAPVTPHTYQVSVVVSGTKSNPENDNFDYLRLKSSLRPDYVIAAATRTSNKRDELVMSAAFVLLSEPSEVFSLEIGTDEKAQGVLTWVACSFSLIETTVG